MTPQDIREKTFEKAMFGGYDMAAVQNYQEEVATELANAQKEVAVLKGKMKVLVDKIEEYRASEVFYRRENVLPALRQRCAHGQKCLTELVFFAMLGIPIMRKRGYHETGPVSDAGHGIQS